MAEYIIMESVDSLNRDGPDTPYVLGIYQYQEYACKMIVHVRTRNLQKLIAIA